MKNHIISLFIIVLSFIVLDSCKNEETINILSIEISKNPNIVMENYNKFFSSHNTSIHFAHLNFRLINKELIITALSVNLKNLYIYNCNKDSLIERNLKEVLLRLLGNDLYP